MDTDLHSILTQNHLDFTKGIYKTINDLSKRAALSQTLSYSTLFEDTIKKYQSESLEIINKLQPSNHLMLGQALKLYLNETVKNSVANYATEFNSKSRLSVQNLLKNDVVEHTSFLLKEANQLSSFRYWKDSEAEILKDLQENTNNQEIAGHSFEDLIILDKEIEDELTDNKKYSDLSDKAKKTLLYIIQFFIIPILTMIIASEINDFRKDSRITDNINLELKVSPRMNANVILELPPKTIINILDKELKSWLLVEAEVNGETKQGWVLRSRTKKNKPWSNAEMSKNKDL